MSNFDPNFKNEWQHHFEQLVAEYCAAGMDAATAQRAARLKLGGADQIGELRRDTWRWAALDNLRRDFAYAARALWKSPGFTFAVVLTLALGIGANTAVFSVLDASLLRPLPVAAPGQLALLSWKLNPNGLPVPLDISGPSGHGYEGSTSNYSFAYSALARLRADAGPWTSHMFGFAPLASGAPVVVGQSASPASAELVTDDYFAGLGVDAVRGRTLNAADFDPRAPRVAVVSYAFWQARLHGSDDAIGQVIKVALTPATVVGVAQRTFRGAEPGNPVDIWLPARPTDSAFVPWLGYEPPGQSVYAASDYWWLEIMARRRDGVTDAELESRLAPLFLQFTRDDLQHLTKPGMQMPQLSLTSGARGVDIRLRRQYGDTLWLLMSGVALLLLLACLNVAALLLARASARRREIGVRLALGARRSRLVAQLLVESVLLALLGGIAAAALAAPATHALLNLLVQQSAWPIEARLDWRVLGFTALIALSAGVLFGLAPALRSTRVDLMAVMKRGVLPGERARLGGDKTLAVAQTALSLLLLIAAGLMGRTLVNFSRQPLGFNPEHVLTFQVNGRDSGYRGAALVSLYARVRERLGALPGVSAVATSQHTLLGGDSGSEDIRAVGGDAAWHGSARNGISPNFFATMQIPLTAGRDINDTDMNSTHRVAIVNQVLASKLFGAANPIGHSLVIETEQQLPSPPYEIIGVAANARYDDLGVSLPPTFYIPYTQLLNPVIDVVYELRTAGPPLSAAPMVRDAVRGIDPNLVVTRLQPQTKLDGATLGQQRLLARLGGAFALLGLLLAAIGLEGTMAYAVNQRTREIGIRMALGSSRSHVLAATIGETVLLAGMGMVLGLALTLASGRVMASQLFGIRPQDPLT
ncbi:MAG TPA: ADOP family duplicated permease, partial [Terriglobales bacterium]